MKLLFFLSHPAHYHLFKHIINALGKRNNILVVIVTKDVLEDLVVQEGWKYTNLFPEGRRTPNIPILLSVIINLVKSEIRLYKFVKSEKPDLLIGTEGTLAHIGKLCGIKSLMMNEDDTAVTPENRIVYPFADKIFTPTCVDPGRWGKKQIPYEGFHELAYLHPDYFIPDQSIVEKFNPGNERFFLIRLAQLTASHDIGKKGIDQELIKALIDFLSKHGKVYITAEYELSEDLKSHLLDIRFEDIHHVLYYADLFIGDSQTMTLESAILGTPAIRINSFAKQCSVILELENKYGLAFSFFPSQSDAILQKVKELVLNPETKKEWVQKKMKMLDEKVDVTKWMVAQIEGEVEILENKKAQ